MIPWGLDLGPLLLKTAFGSGMPGLSPLTALHRRVARAGDLSSLLCSATSRETEAEYDGMSFDCDGLSQASRKFQLSEESQGLTVQYVLSWQKPGS